jgi:hypothetical protein
VVQRRLGKSRGVLRAHQACRMSPTNHERQMVPSIGDRLECRTHSEG